MTTNTAHVHNPAAVAKRKGWELLKAREVQGDGVQAPGFVTLCNTGSRYQPYVVHFFNSQDGGFYHGHYRDTILAADVEYDQQVARYTRHHTK